MTRRGEPKPEGWFVEARGAERMRQSWQRAVAAGATDYDLAVLGAVFQLTIGWSKLDDEATLPVIATELGRWERPEEDDPRTDEQIERARSRKTERLGQSLARLRGAGSIHYEPGRGGRRSYIALPAVDDCPQAQPHAERGVDHLAADALNPTRGGPQPHAARSSTPRGAVPNPTPDGGTTDRTDRSDRVRSKSRAGDSRPARSSTPSPTTADPDDATYADTLAGFITEWIGAHYPGRANPAQEPDVRAVADGLASDVEHLPHRGPYLNDVLRPYIAGATLANPMELWRRYRQHLADLEVDDLPPTKPPRRTAA